MKYLVFLDIDGTVFSGRGISDATIRGVKRAIDAGHLVFINTGRSRYVVPREVVNELPVSGLVCGL